MRRLLVVVPALAIGASLALAMPSCATDSAGCNQGQLATEPAFLLPFVGRTDEDGCTVGAAHYDQAGNRTVMECGVYYEDCLCQGGGVPGVYEVVVYDVESGEEIDDCEVTVYSAAAPECRESEVTRGFHGAFRHSFFGVGGAGGAGGAGGYGGSP
jgi:hypothetical protein